MQALIVVAIAAAFLGGLIALGRWGLERIRDRDRYAVGFAEIDCLPPPGLARGAFLDEVQYLSRFPDRFGILDDDLPERLTGAFLKHPWVARVDAVITKPPRQVEVRLVMRRPVLAVNTKEGLIAVDSQGVRLPKGAVTEGLPQIDSAVAAPPAGTQWGDSKVVERAGGKR